MQHEILKRRTLYVYHGSSQRDLSFGFFWFLNFKKKINQFRATVRSKTSVNCAIFPKKKSLFSRNECPISLRRVYRRARASSRKKPHTIFQNFWVIHPHQLQLNNNMADEIISPPKMDSALGNPTRPFAHVRRWTPREPCPGEEEW